MFVGIAENEDQAEMYRFDLRVQRFGLRTKATRGKLLPPGLLSGLEHARECPPQRNRQTDIELNLRGFGNKA